METLGPSDGVEGANDVWFLRAYRCCFARWVEVLMGMGS